MPGQFAFKFHLPLLAGAKDLFAVFAARFLDGPRFPVFGVAACFHSLRHLAVLHRLDGTLRPERNLELVVRHAHYRRRRHPPRMQFRRSGIELHLLAGPLRDEVLLFDAFHVMAEHGVHDDVLAVLLHLWRIVAAFAHELRSPADLRCFLHGRRLNLVALLLVPLPFFRRTCSVRPRHAVRQRTYANRFGRLHAGQNVIDVFRERHVRGGFLLAKRLLHVLPVIFDMLLEFVGSQLAPRLRADLVVFVLGGFRIVAVEVPSRSENLVLGVSVKVVARHAFDTPVED